ncbi:MAG: hypothetical protein FWG89_04705 [Treponema sp.]|nr:hypothetical protein [Treponema sp.]
MKIILTIITGLITIFTACTPIHIGGEIVLGADGSGSRKIAMYIYDDDDQFGGGGNAYHYLRVHGDELKTAVEDKLKTALTDTSWLTVTVTRGFGAMWNTEIVTLSFDFFSFDDYANKMRRLASFGRNSLPIGSEFRTPSLRNAPNNQWRYTEPANTTYWAVRPLFLAIMDDPAIFDITSGGRNRENDKNALMGMLIMEAVEFKAVLGTNPPLLFLSGTDIDELFPKEEG